MGRTRHRQKSCDRCHQSAPVLYRVRAGETRPWQFLCDRCLPAAKADNPHYVYGGTWKAKKS